jgi:hypothetical protein
MLEATNLKIYFRSYIALPQDHGSWVFILSPLLIGLFAGGAWSSATLFLILSALAAFLIRQPITIIVKAYIGRRSTRDLPAAYFWTIIYALLGLVGLTGLLLQGFGYILILALPGLFVFGWHLYLVSQRAERRQMGVEIVGIGVLALSAPAAYWVGQGYLDPTGWLLWLLSWFQAAASIVYAYLRLEQRNLNVLPDLHGRLHMARRALIYSTFNLLAVGLLALLGVLPVFLPAAFAIQSGETVWGCLRPAMGWKPTRIGMRQLVISSLFTVVFILAWNLSP